MPIVPPKVATLKNTYLWIELQIYAKKTSRVENVLFLRSKESNEVIYKKYISEASATQVNLPAAMQKTLDDLAKKKKWADMKAGLALARKEIQDLTDVNIMRDFVRTPDGKVALAIWRMGLDGAKADQAEGYLRVYLKPRTPEDGWKAFQAMVKLAGEAKVRTALKEYGEPAPAIAPGNTDAQQVERYKKVDLLVKQMDKDTTDALRYFESAIASVKREGLPVDDHEVNRMFESGRRRHDKVVVPYNKAILARRDFATVYSSFMTKKEKLDTQWAAYRTAIAEAEKKRGGR